MIKICLICSKPFNTFPCRDAKYCSHACAAKGTLNGYKPGHPDVVTKAGRKQQGMKMRQYSGERCWNWRGNNVSIKAIHSWLYRNFGKPRSFKCELCHKQACDWSFKTHEYKRDRKEFWTLCRKCHTLYDLRMGLRKMPTFGRSR